MRKPITKKINNSKANMFKTYRMTALLVIGNFIVIGMLLMLMTKSDIQSANIQESTSALSSISIQNQIIQGKIAEAQNIDNVTIKAQSLGMVPASDILYLQSSGIYSDNVH